MIDISGRVSQATYFMILDHDPKPCIIHYIVHFLNKNIRLSNDMCICEGGVCCIGDLYYIINLDKQIGNGFGGIIWYDHVIFGILYFSSSNGSI